MQIALLGPPMKEALRIAMKQVGFLHQSFLYFVLFVASSPPFNATERPVSSPKYVPGGKQL